MKKTIGYTRGLPDSTEAGLALMPLYPTLDDLQQGWRTKHSILLEFISEASLIDYEVREDREGSRTYRPVRIRDRIRRYGRLSLDWTIKVLKQSLDAGNTF